MTKTTTRKKALKWERVRAGWWRAFSPVFGWVAIQKIRTGGYALISTDWTGGQLALLSRTDTMAEAKRDAVTSWYDRNPKRKAPPQKHKRNPGELLVFGANPKGGTRGAKVLGKAHQLKYLHRTQGARVHDFGGSEVVELLPDGSFRVYHPSGVRLWDDL